MSGDSDRMQQMAASSAMPCAPCLCNFRYRHRRRSVRTPAATAAAHPAAAAPAATTASAPGSAGAGAGAGAGASFPALPSSMSDAHGSRRAAAAPPAASCSCAWRSHRRHRQRTSSSAPAIWNIDTATWKVAMRNSQMWTCRRAGPGGIVRRRMSGQASSGAGRQELAR